MVRRETEHALPEAVNESTQQTDRRRTLWVAAAALPALCVFLVQVGWTYPFFSDDSFISLRYAERLLEGQGLTWTDGERVEGYSNLLWVLLVALFGACGVELVTAARALGVLCTIAALLGLAAALRPRGPREAAVAAVAPLLVAGSQPVLVWSIAGLEGPLMLALLAWGFAGLAQLCRHQTSDTPPRARALLVAGAPFALACWTRPDSPLWALTAGVGVGLGWLGHSRGAVRQAVNCALLFGAPAMVAASLQTAFRFVYYGDLVPNTAHVKAELALSSLEPGAAFVVDALTSMPALTVAATIGALAAMTSRRSRSTALPPLLAVLAWLAYLCVIGGDHFPGLRLLHGALAPLALLAGLGLARLPRATGWAAAAALAGAGLAGADAFLARANERSQEARAEVWEWHGKALGDVLGRAFADQQARLAVDAAGALPYYSKLPCLDMLGLCDRTIATTPFPAWIETVRPEIPRPPGHMRGNGAYVMDRQPDLMVFQHAPGLPLPVFVSACEFEDDPRFLEGYRMFLLDLGQPEILPGVRQPHLAPIWVRRTGRCGVRREQDAVVIPAYLFGAFRLGGPVTRKHQPASDDLDAEQRAGQNLAAIATFLQSRSPVAVATAGGPLSLALAAGQSATVRLRLEPGAWSLRCEPKGCGADARVGGADRFVVDSQSEVEITLRAGADGAAPERVRLLRER